MRDVANAVAFRQMGFHARLDVREERRVGRGEDRASRLHGVGRDIGGEIQRRVVGGRGKAAVRRRKFDTGAIDNRDAV